MYIFLFSINYINLLAAVVYYFYIFWFWYNKIIQIYRKKLTIYCINMIYMYVHMLLITTIIMLYETLNERQNYTKHTVQLYI